MLEQLDQRFTLVINQLNGQIHLIDQLMILASTAGVPLMVFAVAAQWWGRRDARAVHRHTLVASGFSFLLGLALNQAVLLFVQRMRPYDAGLTHLIVAPSTDFSFPSDHATAAFSVAAAFLLHGRRVQGLALLAVAALIAFSRVYIGIHYLSDVLGGAATGVIAALLVRFGYRQGSALDRWLVSRL
ncbi:phosphatase PAP2 family protein [Marinobacter sp. C2H3]|uniref:phosphatase PAP2 family protein n=1 Tax=Marinobacter sp. C2H3 TaxID=3119003 RepID=UPI00300F609E